MVLLIVGAARRVHGPQPHDGHGRAGPRLWVRIPATDSAGFDISESPIPYTPRDTYAKAFLVGLLNTLFVSVLGIILATILGVVVGVARLSPNWLVRRITSAYVELMRNTPLLVQLVLIYFAVCFSSRRSRIR